MAFPNGTPLVACSADQPKEIEVHAFHRENGSLALRTRVDLGESYWPHLATLPDDDLILAAQTRESVVASRSPDAGHTFGDPVDLRDPLSADDGWEGLDFMWIATDPWGAVHFLLREDPCPSDPTYLLALTCDFALPRESMDVVHAAFSPSLDEILAERQLDPPDTSPEEHRPESAAPSYGDHFFGADFGPERGVLAWTQDKAIELTAVVPEGTGSTSP